MITLSEQDIRTTGRRSSKGNQLKWMRERVWYKADYTGYEGLSEYVVSKERLFEEAYGESLYKSIFGIRDHESRLRFLTEQTEYLTGIENMGAYLTKLLTIDTFFLNEDRHTHNIAVMLDEEKVYPKEIKDRVYEILLQRMRKYQYLFLDYRH